MIALFLCAYCVPIDFYNSKRALINHFIEFFDC